MFTQLVPIVVSKEIAFVTCMFRADPTCISDIVKKLARADNLGTLGARYNQSLLRANSNRSAAIWMEWIREHSF